MSEAEEPKRPAGYREADCCGTCFYVRFRQDRDGSFHLCSKRGATTRLWPYVSKTGTCPQWTPRGAGEGDDG